VVELKLGLKTVDLPYTLRIYGVTEEKFDELTDPKTRAELLDGVMIVHSQASPRQDDLAGFLHALLQCYAGATRLGVVLGPRSVVRLAARRYLAPDVYFFRQERVPRPLPERYLDGSPDLVLDVRPPAGWGDRRAYKLPAYRQAGVPDIWLIDPDERQVAVDRISGRRYHTTTTTTGRVSSSVLTDFWLEADWLWSDPLPNPIHCLKALLA
jgi:Uma2 family endonuclease